MFSGQWPVRFERLEEVDPQPATTQPLDDEPGAEYRGRIRRDSEGFLLPAAGRLFPELFADPRLNVSSPHIPMNREGDKPG